MLFVFMVVSFLCGCSVQAQAVLEVITRQGTVTGAAANNGMFYAFYGIHYAGYVSGANRFKAPPPAPAYPGTFHAIDNSKVCAQPSRRGYIGDEDCLLLNVYTKNVNTPKPVVVFIQGEDYDSTEDKNYSYQNLVNEDIVVVTVNYRLSVFGFLCLGVEEAPGNAGLKDVIQALKWVQTNIANFGGNPNNVMLLGHGTAAAMVELITMSPTANNLVHKAAALSGSALAPWAISYEPVKYAEELGRKLGYQGKTLSELAQFLANTDKYLLVNAINEIELLNNTVLFAPCIENTLLNPNDTALSDSPFNIIKSGNYSQIPIIMSYTDREGTLRAQEALYSQWLTKMQDNFAEFVQVDLDFGNNKTAMTQTIYDRYFDQSIAIDEFFDYQGDVLALVPAIRGARERAATSSAPVRLFEFGFRGTANTDWNFPQITLIGAKRGDILNYLFDYDLLPSDAAIKTSVTKLFSTFAHTGTPTPTGLTGSWEPFSASSPRYLIYSGADGSNVSSITVLVNPHSQKMTFWDNLYFHYYKAPRSVSSGNSIIGFSLFIILTQIFVKVVL